jgi:hypothetical protein
MVHNTTNHLGKIQERKKCIEQKYMLNLFCEETLWRKYWFGSIDILWKNKIQNRTEVDNTANHMGKLQNVKNMFNK